MNTQNQIINFFTNMTTRTRALAIWSPLCITAAFALAQNVGVINGGTIIALAAFAATGYKTVTGLVD